MSYNLKPQANLGIWFFNNLSPHSHYSLLITETSCGIQMLLFQFLFVTTNSFAFCCAHLQPYGTVIFILFVLVSFQARAKFYICHLSDLSFFCLCYSMKTFVISFCLPHYTNPVFLPSCRFSLCSVSSRFCCYYHHFLSACSLSSWRLVWQIFSCHLLEGWFQLLLAALCLCASSATSV